MWILHTLQVSVSANEINLNNIGSHILFNALLTHLKFSSIKCIQSIFMDLISLKRSGRKLFNIFSFNFDLIKPLHLFPVVNYDICNEATWYLLLIMIFKKAKFSIAVNCGIARVRAWRLTVCWLKSLKHTCNSPRREDNIKATGSSLTSCLFNWITFLVWEQDSWLRRVMGAVIIWPFHSNLFVYIYMW